MKKFRLEVISFMLVIAVFAGVVSVSAADKAFKYEEQVKKLFFEKYSYIPEDTWNSYREYYEYFVSGGEIPDCVVIGAYITKEDIDWVEIIGDYVITNYNTCFPDKTNYFVYVPSENALYILAEFYNSDFELFKMLIQEEASDWN